MKYTDPDGNFIESGWDLVSAAFGALNTFMAFKSGDIFAGILSGIGTLIDGATAFIPGIPGGVSIGLKVASSGTAVIDAAKNMFEGIKTKDNGLIAMSVFELIGTAAGIKGEDYLNEAKFWYDRLKKVTPEFRVGIFFNGLREEHKGIFLKIMSIFGLNAELIKSSAEAADKFLRSNNDIGKT